ncbi:MAG: DUF3160 domain-containing protein, partial [Patescibacteria group bacterium]|nr:DUF3160 domain-containing protein [Patescibacteria group bacterium]
SPYARAALPQTSFYSQHKNAVDTRLSALTAEANTWGDAYWQNTSYGSTLWTISGLFDWLEKNRPSLPAFMGSPLWSAKTLMTGSAFWTELRHTAILYAKQSFAEKGGGGDDSCDTRSFPPPPKGYVEPDPAAYDRLSYMAQRLSAEYKARGYDLENLPRLDSYIKLLDVVKDYTKRELENTPNEEPTVTTTRHSYDENKDCVETKISPFAAVVRPGDPYVSAHVATSTDNGMDVASLSRWEELRVDLVNRMQESLPVPVEGPILPIKDKRAALVADVHTDKDGNVLEEGTGVPRLIFVAVKDANGPRLTVGFTYSQYESVSPGDRLTDEQWQSNFYEDTGDDSTITYKPKSEWPDITPWYQELLGKK